jgi:hypothetical protein
MGFHESWAGIANAPSEYLQRCRPVMHASAAPEYSRCIDPTMIFDDL